MHDPNPTDGQEGDNASQLRVGIVTSSFPVPANTSSGIFVERLVAHLPDSIRATVLTPCPDSALSKPDGRAYTLTCFKYGPRSWLRLAHRPGGLPDAWRRRDPALLLLPLFLPALFIGCLRLAGRVDVLHGNWSLPAVIAAVAGRVRGRPAIATLRGEDISRAEGSPLFRWLLASCLALNERTVVVSESMRDHLHREFPKYTARIEFVPNGVLSGEGVARSAFRSPLRLITVGSLIHRKRLETLLQALAHPACPAETVLRVVGDGPERGSLESTARSLALGSRVEFVGGVPPEQVAKHLCWADIFVFGSESEGRPNAVLEAMAEGMPILATDIPGVRELIGSGAGLLYPVGDSTTLAQAISTVSTDPQSAHTLGREAKARIERSGLTWPAAGFRYAALYREITTGTRKH